MSKEKEKQNVSKEKERQNMSNDVTTTGPNPYEVFGESATRGTGVYIKFAKGDYVGGPNADEIPIGTLMIADMTELRVGWVRWEEGSPSDRVMGKLTDGRAAPSWAIPTRTCGSTTTVASRAIPGSAALSCR
jgi:hypothetical protein